MELELDHEADSVKIIIKEKDNNMEKEIKQEQEKNKSFRGRTRSA